MRNLAKNYFKVMQIVSLVFAIVFCITIVGVIFAIPLFMASKRFKLAYQCSFGDKDQELISRRGSLLGWGIFTAIVLSSTIIGLIIVLIFAIMVNNFIKDLESGNVEKANRTVADTVKDAFGAKSSAEKLREQLNGLKSLRDDGIITEEEYQQRRKNIIEKA